MTDDHSNEWLILVDDAEELFQKAAHDPQHRDAVTRYQRLIHETRNTAWDIVAARELTVRALTTPTPQPPHPEGRNAMTDTTEPVPDNRTRSDIGHAYELATIPGPSIPLGQWAAHGDWATILTQESRDHAGRKALDDMDRVLADVQAVRNRLADALGEPITTAAAVDTDDWVPNQAQADLAADCVLFARDENRKLHVLLIQRDPDDESDPFRGYWALPGGGMDLRETFAATAVRELAEETDVVLNLDRDRLLGVDVFDAPDRDPRGRVISKAFVVMLSRPISAYNAKAGDDAHQLAWLPVSDSGRLVDDVTLAFDHEAVIVAAATRLRQITIDPTTPGLAERLAEAHQAVAHAEGTSLPATWSALWPNERAAAIVDAGNWLRALHNLTQES